MSRWPYSDVFSIGDIAVVAKDNSAWTVLFSQHDEGRICGDVVANLQSDDIVLVVDTFPAHNTHNGESNEHVILVISSRGIGYTWRGFFDRL